MLDTTGKFTKLETSDNTAAASVLILVTAVMVLFLGCVVKSWILCKLWSWYIVPFFGFRELSLSVAYGICLINSYLQNIIHVEDKRKASEKLITAIAKPVLVLFFGWLGTLFI